MGDGPPCTRCLPDPGVGPRTSVARAPFALSGTDTGARSIHSTVHTCEFASPSPSRPPLPSSIWWHYQRLTCGHIRRGGTRRKNERVSRAMGSIPPSAANSRLIPCPTGMSPCLSFLRPPLPSESICLHHMELRDEYKACHGSSTPAIAPQSPASQSPFLPSAGSQYIIRSPFGAFDFGSTGMLQPSEEQPPRMAV